MITFFDLLPSIKQRLAEERYHFLVEQTKKPVRITITQRSNDSLQVDRVDTTDGIKTYLKGAPVPTRSNPDANSVILTAMYKRFIPLIVQSLERQGWFGKITTLLALKNNVKAASDWFGYIFKLNTYLLKEEYWCQPIKEVRRVLKGRMDDNLIDAISLVLEYDGAYKYRFQDVVGELDKTKGISEVGRMFNLLAQRDAPDMSRKFIKIKKLVQFFLYFPKVRKAVKEIIKDLNVGEIKFSKEDLYWVNMNPSYEYRGLSIEQRMRDNIQKYGKNVL